MPALAPLTPPLTGQSIMATPRARARSARGKSSDSAIVLHTMTVPAGHGVEEAVAPAQHRVDLCPADHHHHRARALGADLRRMARGAAAERGKAGEGLGGDVVGEHVMAGLEKIGGHAEAHLAQPDESDGAR